MKAFTDKVSDDAKKRFAFYRKPLLYNFKTGILIIQVHSKTHSHITVVMGSYSDIFTHNIF